MATCELHPGQRVRVRFAHKEYVAVVHCTCDTADVETSRIQPICGIAEGYPDISARELRLWEFTSSYYLCTIGEVYKAACPASAIDRDGAWARENDRLKDRISRIGLELQKRSSSKRASEAVTARLRTEKESLEACLEDRTESMAAAKYPAVYEGTPPRPIVLTGSKRSGDYLKRIRQTTAQGRSVLILTPDIIYFEKLHDELSPLLPEMMSYNSRMSQAIRSRVAAQVRRSASAVVLGTRSSIFLPFADLGLIIIDNEQDVSFKQDDPAPRYNARDLAVALARIHGAEVLIGTSTPSLETEANCIRGKYARSVSDRNAILPAIIDISIEKRKRGMRGDMSIKLIEHIRNTGGPFLLIRGWEDKESLKEQCAALFPGREIRIATFSEAKSGSLRGFAGIAVLNADAYIPRDDFRGDEKALNILRSLAELSGNLAIQTSGSANRIFSAFGESGETILNEMLKERQDFNLPPFSRLVDIVFNDDNEKRKSLMMSQLGRKVSEQFALTGMTQNRIRITFRSGASLSSEKEQLCSAVESFTQEKKYQGHIHLDVDPA